MYNLYIMASDPEKTELLFKEFVGVVNVRQNDPFNSGDHKYPFRSYVTNESIFSNNIPADLSNITYTSFGQTLYGSTALDASFANSGAVLGISYEIPGTDLVFYYKAEMSQPSPNTNKTWYIDDGDGLFNSLMKDSIPFLYDATQKKSYLQTLWSNSGTNSLDVYESPLFWLMDYQSGFIEMYGDQQDVTDWITTNGTPRLSFIKYNGPKGSSGGGGGGGDASFNNLDVSNNLIVNSTQFLQKIGPSNFTVDSASPYYRIARVNMSTLSTPVSGSTVCSGRFIIKAENNLNVSLEFIAGFYCDNFTLNTFPTNLKPFIKVLSSNGEDLISKSINFIAIGIDAQGGIGPISSNIELVLGFSSSAFPLVINNASVRLYQNNEGKDTGTYRDWSLDSDFINYSAFNPGTGASFYNIYKQLNLDKFNDISYATGTSMAMSSLDSETFMGNVNVGGKLTVLNGFDLSGSINAIDPSGIIDISGNLILRDVSMQNLTVNQTLTVNGITTLNDPVFINDNISLKTGSTIDASSAIINSAYLYVDNIYALGGPFSTGSGKININANDLAFTPLGGGGTITDLSNVIAKNGNLDLSGTLTFNSSLSSNNIIRELYEIQPVGGLGGNLQIEANTSFQNNNLSNIDIIIPGPTQSNILTISGDLYFLPTGDISNVDHLTVKRIMASSGSDIIVNSDLSMNGDINMNDNNINDVNDTNINNINIRGTNLSFKNIYGTEQGSAGFDPSGLIIENRYNLDLKSSQGNIYGLSDSIILSNNSAESTTNTNYLQIRDGSGIKIVTKVNNPIELNAVGPGNEINITVGGNGVVDYKTLYIDDKVGHNFSQRGIIDISQSVILNNLPTGTEYVANNIGSNVQDNNSNTQVVNCEIPTYWLENGWNVDPSYSRQLLMLGSQIKYDIYNNYLTGPVGSGDPTGAIKPTYNTQASSYRYWDSTASSTPIGDIAIFTPFTYIATGGSLIPARINIKEKILRDGWITGFSLKWPWGSGGGGSILDISGTAKLIFYTTGVGKYDNGGTLSNMGKIDLYTFTSSNQSNLGDGLTISLNPRDWIYIEAETDLNNIFKIRLESGQSNSLAFSATNNVGIRYGAIADSALNVAYSESSVRGSVYIWSPPNAYPSYKNY